MKSMATSDSYNAKPQDKSAVVKPSSPAGVSEKKTGYANPDFSKMTPAEKLEWNLKRIRQSY